jgi:hypothetical protein
MSSRLVISLDFCVVSGRSQKQASEGGGDGDGPERTKLGLEMADGKTLSLVRYITMSSDCASFTDANLRTFGMIWCCLVNVFVPW